MNVILSKDAKKQYEALPKLKKKLIFKKLSALQNNPIEGKKLSGELDGLRSLRCWPYRVIYEINKKENRIEVHKIAHRQGVYK